MADKKSGSGKKPPDDKSVDGTRRSMLRMFVNPFASMVVGYKEPDNPGVYFKPNAPGKRRVLKGGCQAAFLEMLGPYARGVLVPGGFRLWGVSIKEDTIEVNFMRPNQLVQLIFAGVWTGQAGEGVEAGSFRIRTGGNAPSEAVHEVVTAVGNEVRARDTGTLWVEVGIPPPKEPEKKA